MANEARSNLDNVVLDLRTQNNILTGMSSNIIGLVNTIRSQSRAAAEDIKRRSAERQRGFLQQLEDAREAAAKKRQGSFGGQLMRGLVGDTALAGVDAAGAGLGKLFHAGTFSLGFLNMLAGKLIKGGLLIALANYMGDSIADMLLGDGEELSSEAKKELDGNKESFKNALLTGAILKLFLGWPATLVGGAVTYLLGQETAEKWGELLLDGTGITSTNLWEKMPEGLQTKIKDNAVGLAAGILVTILGFLNGKKLLSLILGRLMIPTAIATAVATLLGSTGAKSAGEDQWKMFDELKKDVLKRFQLSEINSEEATEIIKDWIKQDESRETMFAPGGILFKNTPLQKEYWEDLAKSSAEEFRKNEEQIADEFAKRNPLGSLLNNYLQEFEKLFEKLVNKSTPKRPDIPEDIVNRYDELVNEVTKLDKKVGKDEEFLNDEHEKLFYELKNLKEMYPELDEKWLSRGRPGSEEQSQLLNPISYKVTTSYGGTYKAIEMRQLNEEIARRTAAFVNAPTNVVTSNSNNSISNSNTSLVTKISSMDPYTPILA